MRACLLLLFLVGSYRSIAQDTDLLQLVQQHARELDSAGAHFKGWSFLDTLLANKRVVLLGESSHGTEEYSRLKFRLIRYLHEKLGYDVLLFESPMTNASYLPFADDTAAVELVKNSIQSVWHTVTVGELFRYVKSSGLQFSGFDPQFMHSTYPALLYGRVFGDEAVIKNKLLQLESKAAATVGHPGAYLSLRDSFSLAYGALARQLAALPLTPLQQWLQQIVVTNEGYYKRIQEGDQRDSCMAKNIIWLAEHLYAGKKIMVWAHNTHIDKNPGNKRIMGKLLAAHFKDQLYGIGLYMQHGSTALNNRKIVPVKPAMKGSVEALLASTRFRTTFMPVHSTLFDRKMPAWHWGTTKHILNPHKSYDAIVLIDGVQAPDYLPY